jgi:hypothetical protein
MLLSPGTFLEVGDLVSGVTLLYKNQGHHITVLTSTGVHTLFFALEYGACLP